MAHFQGDNFARTYRGVAGDEVRVVVFFDGTTSGTQAGTSRGVERPPDPGTLVDLAEPARSEDEFVFLRVLRAYQRYFNDRYQTYGRFVRFFVHFGRADRSPESRRADAAEQMSRVAPFAVVANATDNADAYVTAMTRNGVVAFLGSYFVAWQSADFYSRWPGLVWSYSPSTESRARLFSTYACAKAVGHPVSFSGEPLDAGRPRVFGIVRSSDARRQDRILYADAIEREMASCGAEFAATGHVHATDTQTVQGAPGDMANFRRAGVTTVVWAASSATYHTEASGAIGYRPEWLVAGSNLAEGNLAGRLNDQTVWRHARAVTTYTSVTDPERQVCFLAAREGDPGLGSLEIRNYGCDYYLDLRQLFTGIQVAGPRLTPRSMDVGFHAIPAVASDDPTVPACFYDPGDYTCVKDSQAQSWDPAGTAPDGKTGCWRMMQHGRRHLAGRWPPGDVEAQRRPDDPCNLQARQAA